MHLSLHMLLMEPEHDRAQMLVRMLATIAVDTTRVPDLARAAQVLTQVQPDGLAIGVHTDTTRLVRSWLASLLPSNPLPTLLYAEQGSLLEVVTIGLPPPLATVLWPCSQSDLVLALQSLFRGFRG